MFSLASLYVRRLSLTLESRETLRDRPPPPLTKGALVATKINLSNLSTAQRRALATRIAKARAKGQSWDGPKGICETMGLSGAPVGRKLLREYKLVEKAGGIAPSYDRKAAKAARESEAKKAKRAARKPKAQPTAQVEAPKVEA